MVNAVSSDIISSVLEPFADCFTPELARRIAALRATPATQERLNDLADKANDDRLTEAERVDYDRFRSVFHFVTILQSQARAYLQSHAAE